MDSRGELKEKVIYHGVEKKIYIHNCTPIILNHVELKKLILVANETNLNISTIIRLQSQPCCNCGCTNIRYTDEDTGELKEFKKPSFMSKRKRNYFSKKKI